MYKRSRKEYKKVLRKAGFELGPVRYLQYVASRHKIIKFIPAKVPGTREHNNEKLVYEKFIYRQTQAPDLNFIKTIPMEMPPMRLIQELKFYGFSE